MSVEVTSPQPLANLTPGLMFHSQSTEPSAFSVKVQSSRIASLVGPSADQSHHTKGSAISIMAVGGCSRSTNCSFPRLLTALSVPVGLRVITAVGAGVLVGAGVAVTTIGVPATVITMGVGVSAGVAVAGTCVAVGCGVGVSSSPPHAARASAATMPRSPIVLTFSLIASLPRFPDWQFDGSVFTTIFTGCQPIDPLSTQKTTNHDHPPTPGSPPGPRQG